MATPSETVDAFVAAVGKRDMDAALALLAEDVVYDNVPLPTVTGRDGVRSFLGPFLQQASAVEFVVHRQVADGELVVNERTDRFQFGEKSVELPVAGFFEVRDGLISLWRDYFDMQGFAGLAGG